MLPFVLGSNLGCWWLEGQMEGPEYARGSPVVPSQ